MAPNSYPLPKIVDERFPQYFRVTEDLNASPQPSHHALRVAQNGKLDIYGDDVYDFNDPRFPGKGCFSNFSSQPIKIDGIKYHSAEHYLRTMSCEDSKEASDVFFNQGFNVKPTKISPNFLNHKKEIMETMVHAKLSQHLDTAAELLATGNLYMAYTSSDEEYGTGMKGQGRNMLGELYMNARDEMLRVILQNKKVGAINNPTSEQLAELAQDFQNDHPENIMKRIKDMTGKEVKEIVDQVYPGGPDNVKSPEKCSSSLNFNAIRSDKRYTSHQCHDRYEYLRPHLLSNYYEKIYDKYQEILYEKESNGQQIVRPLKEQRDQYAFYGPIDFLFRGVGPIPGPAPLAVISAIICFGLMATGVGAVGIAVVAIMFSAVSGAIQAYKSATENGLDLKKTVVTVLLGAAAGILAPWPGLGPLMSALYVKAIEKGLKMGRKAMDIHFPKKDKELPSQTQDKDRGVEVMYKRERGVEVLHQLKRVTDVIPPGDKNKATREVVSGADVPRRGVDEGLKGNDKKKVDALARSMSGVLSSSSPSSPDGSGQLPSQQVRATEDRKKSASVRRINSKGSLSKK